MNDIVIIGRVVRDIELKTTSDGKEYCGICVASDRRFGKDSEGRALSDFFDCTAFGQNAAFIAKYFSKGKPICITGDMICDKYTDKDGNNRKAWKVNVSNAAFVPRDSSGEASANTTAPNTTAAASVPEFEEVPIDDDLPF